MKLSSAACLGIILLLSSCSHDSYIERVREVPLKSVEMPGIDSGLHRANTSYLMHGALTSKERFDRLGQYYYVVWHDGQPEKSARLEMKYQQSGTGSKVLTKTLTLKPERSGGTTRTNFEFIGDNYRTNGNVLSWKITLFVDGKPVSSRQSYLWRNDASTNGII